MLKTSEVSELITDMTLKGATKDEIKKVVRHSINQLDFEKAKRECEESELRYDVQYYWRKYHLNEEIDELDKTLSFD